MQGKRQASVAFMAFWRQQRTARVFVLPLSAAPVALLCTLVLLVPAVLASVQRSAAQGKNLCWY